MVTATGTVQTIQLNGNEVELISSAGHINKLPMNEIALDRLAFPINTQVTHGVIVETDPDMFQRNYHRHCTQYISPCCTSDNVD